MGGPQRARAEGYVLGSAFVYHHGLNRLHTSMAQE